MQIKNRIKELRIVSASQLVKSGYNWRTHSDYQLSLLRDIIEEVGFAGAVIARERSDGSLEIIDGHARAELAGNEEVPVLILDVNDTEAKKILATYDPIGALAGTDSERLDALLGEVEIASQGVTQMLEQLRAKVEPPEPPEEFEELTADIDTNRVCPKCGYRWSE